MVRSGDPADDYVVDAPQPSPAAFDRGASARPAAGRARGLSGTEMHLYRLLVESVQDYAIFALDAGGHIITWSAGARRLKGYSRDEILGRHFSVFYRVADIESGKPAMELAVATAEGRFERVAATVRDTGRGIAADQHDAIFEPFVQLGRSLTSPHEGTGLGLAISRDMARGMGGDITVESMKDVGSTFTFTLPVTKT